jgi:transcriptional regulator with XRE-family HTH domain
MMAVAPRTSKQSGRDGSKFPDLIALACIDAGDWMMCCWVASDTLLFVVMPTLPFTVDDDNDAVSIGLRRVNMPRGRQRVEGGDATDVKGGHPIDIHVGSRIRLRRTLRGMSQEKLGESIGLTFQQVQKYERGANRVSASRLFELSKVLDVPVSFFFDDLPASQRDPAFEQDSPTQVGGSVPENAMFKRETLELVRAFYRIPDEATRRALYNLVKATAAADLTGTGGERAVPDLGEDNLKASRT